MPADPTSSWALIAGGGTGGHVYPGLTIAAELVERGHPASSIHWIGSEIGVEVDLVPAAGFGLTVLPGRGLNGRRIDLDNLRAAIGLVRASLRGIGEVRRRRPAVVVSLGGYAAVAAVVGAAVCRVPLVVTEQNVRGSLANRLAARIARVCAVPFEGSDLPKAVVTGNPVRPEIVEASRMAADAASRTRLRAELGVPDGATLVAAMSGSLGARSVNRAVVGMTERLSDRGDVVVHHVIGRRDWGTEHAPAPALPAGASVTYRAVEYEDRPDRLLAATDLFIGRAGGSTVAELAVVGVPSVLVPLPIAPRDAQHHNAEPLVRAGAARRIPDAECTPERLAELVVELLAEATTLPAMAAAARSVGHPDAAARVADLIEEHARG
jgi:UDP-N-acetylglucosamine--N-acetylmuramyl-(pentapeptide) pyrophosphoryl-undecaprenol N-acetylglucosamine transferase